MTNELAPLLHVDLTALTANYERLQRCAPHARVGATVKADAYGLGLRAVTTQLYEHAGCRDFFVAYATEGQQLRRILPTSRIFVFHGVDVHTLDLFEQYQLIPVLNSLAQVTLWQNSVNKTNPCALHIDTGMNRLGLQMQDVIDLTKSGTTFGALNLVLLLTHLAKASEGDVAVCQQQTVLLKESLQKLLPIFPDLPVSLSASAGAFLDLEYPEQLLRPGISLYGGGTVDARAVRLSCVATLKAPILQVRTVQAGDGIGYGHTFTAPKKMTTATIAIGYADGFARAHSNKGQVFLHDTICPIVGRISMDTTCIDVSHIVPSARVGDMVELFGPNLSIDMVARTIDAISYELIASLKGRIRRAYHYKCTQNTS